MNTAELIEGLRSTFQIYPMKEEDRCLIWAACRRLEQLASENENLKTALGKALDNAGFKPHIKSLLEFHRQEFPFAPGDNSSEHRERYYWLSGFLHAYAEKWADIDDFGTPSK